MKAYLELHHSNGTAGNHVTDDELGDDVETELVGGDGLDDTNRHGEGHRCRISSAGMHTRCAIEHTEQQGDDVSPDGHLGVPNLDDDDTKDEHDDCEHESAIGMYVERC